MRWRRSIMNPSDILAELEDNFKIILGDWSDRGARHSYSISRLEFPAVGVRIVMSLFHRAQVHVTENGSAIVVQYLIKGGTERSWSTPTNVNGQFDASVETKLFHICEEIMQPLEGEAFSRN